MSPASRLLVSAPYDQYPTAPGRSRSCGMPFARSEALYARKRCGANLMLRARLDRKTISSLGFLTQAPQISSASSQGQFLIATLLHAAIASPSSAEGKNTAAKVRAIPDSLRSRSQIPVVGNEHVMRFVYAVYINMRRDCDYLGKGAAERPFSFKAGAAEVLPLQGGRSLAISFATIDYQYLPPHVARSG